MPRRKILADRDVLASALGVIREHGPDGLTFASLASACGLSGATLVQRFGSKPALLKAAMRHAWDLLDASTQEAIATAPQSAEGVIQMLLALSHGYGDIETYADGLLMLREDLRDPELRDRGKAWQAVLAEAIATRLPGHPREISNLILDQWQGSLLWWSFDPRDKVEHYVERRLRAFLALVTGA
ncbi:TetR/AcrR family transcriptional regulator [Rhizobium sp. TH2]|uniref:TetR/AcrR family transcriptional regulator n=1 Tax=Rhizobium sp. TH2 TaxID=2775403 RepID=UPI0021575007|nr:TetR/AcrR family transcriptional regulator [Rhizobium sp. TH2]UVC09501.1 TetR/AcrR family transcriptional regulator [Rhizobium sp. TH2]